MIRGLRKQLPCGHTAEAVIGAYYQCLADRQCTGRPRPVTCPRCGSADSYEFVCSAAEAGSRACNPCGAVWLPK